jgi:hypothetical protein
MSILGPKKSVCERFMYGTVVAYLAIRSESTFAHRSLTAGVSSVIFLRRLDLLVDARDVHVANVVVVDLRDALPLSSVSNQSSGCG